MKSTKIASIVACLFLGACSTPYQKLTAFSPTGGWKAMNVEGDVYRVMFSANGFTTRETAQTYWLYRCSELTLEKGYGGFEILSNISLVFSDDNKLPSIAQGPIALKVGGGAAPIYVPSYSDNSNKPHIEADIRLLPAPISEAPPKVFDARKLKDALETYVNGKKCDSDNVCPHVHKYLFPEGKFDKAGT